MPIHERILNHERLGESPDAQWFAARQPGIVRFLSERLQGDALALGLFAACRISLAFQGTSGRPNERITSASLAQSEERMCRRKHAHDDASSRDDDLPGRHPALIAWIAALLDDPPVPLAREEQREVGMSLLSVAHAFDRANLS
jgi:hypothetical protein